MSVKPLLAGLRTYVPFVHLDYRGTGGASARYCYTVWLRHLVRVRDGALAEHPRRVLELGPGDSVGVGLAALLSGSEQYTALDVVPHSDPARELGMLDELLALFRARAPIPDHHEFPRVHPTLADYRFPERILPDAWLEATLRPERVEAIRRSLVIMDTAQAGMCRYVCPWHDASVVEAGAFDLVFSQAVLQDIEDEGPRGLESVIASTARWLRPGGVASHDIDLGYPVGAWNEHWRYSDRRWRLTIGRRPYYFNRVPRSRYLALHERAGFQVTRADGLEDRTGVARHRLAPRFRDLDERDRITRLLYITAVRR